MTTWFIIIFCVTLSSTIASVILDIVEKKNKRLTVRKEAYCKLQSYKPLEISVFHDNIVQLRSFLARSCINGEFVGMCTIVRRNRTLFKNSDLFLSSLVWFYKYTYGKDPDFGHWFKKEKGGFFEKRRKFLLKYTDFLNSL